MRRIDRKGLRAPALVLAPVVEVNEEAIEVDRYNTIWCLSRIDSVPQEVSVWNVAEEASVSIWDLRDQLRKKRTANHRFSPAAPQGMADQDATVVICTRDRPAGLRATLASLQRQPFGHLDPSGPAFQFLLAWRRVIISTKPCMCPARASWCRQCPGRRLLSALVIIDGGEGAASMTSCRTYPGVQHVC